MAGRIQFGTRAVLAYALALTGLAGVLAAMGRPWWCSGGEPWPWSGEVWSMHNSQHLLDPYAVTHVTHGLVYYLVLRLALGRRLDESARLVLAVAIEVTWEVIENTTLVVERYRAVTSSLDYFGDSIANSLGDVVACTLGYLLAMRMPWRRTLVAIVVLETLMAVWIRDGLFLNIVMLLYPVDALRTWQTGVAP